MSCQTINPIEFFVQELDSTAEHQSASSSFPSKEEDARARHPWDDAHPKLMVPFQARLPDRLHKKLQWVSQHSIGGPSMQELLLTGAERYLDERIAEIEDQLYPRAS